MHLEALRTLADKRYISVIIIIIIIIIIINEKLIK